MVLFSCAVLINMRKCDMDFLQLECSSFSEGLTSDLEGKQADLPMTELESAPKAQMHWEPPGTWNLEKLHVELKYLGRKLAEASLWRRVTEVLSATAQLQATLP